VSRARLNDRVRGTARRWRAESTSGNALVEFAMIAPVFFLLIFAIMEIGIIFFAQSTLQHANEVVARLIRTGQVQGQSMTQTQVRQIVCSNAAPLIPCNGNLYVDVRAFTNFGGVVFSPPLDATGHMNSMNTFQPGVACNVVLVRSFYTWTVFTPVLTPFLKNMAGNYHLISSASTFRNEPYSTGLSGC
jgi:Flp pilus assembly protein TadG